MPRIRILLVAALAVLTLAVAGAVQASAQTTSLVGKVGPGFTITLTKSGKAVKTLAPGTYKMTINDESTGHNFDLFGPGVSKKTSVQGTGTVVWTVTLTKGSYTYQCDIHFASGMIGHFTVA